MCKNVVLTVLYFHLPVLIEFPREHASGGNHNVLLSQAINEQLQCLLPGQGEQGRRLGQLVGGECLSADQESIGPTLGVEVVLG